MASYRELLVYAAERASDHYEKVVGGPVFPGDVDHRGRAGGLGLVGRRARARGSRGRRAGRCGRARPGGYHRSPLLRVRGRGRPRGGHGGGRADQRVGPACFQRRHLPGGGGGRGHRRDLVERAPAPARRRLLRLRDRRPGGQYGGAGGGSPPRPGPGGLGRRAARAPGRPARAGGRQRRAPRHHRPGPDGCWGWAPACSNRWPQTARGR